MRLRLPSSLLVSAILAWLVAAASCNPPDDPTNRARDLERRILAPCCYRQTLEDHDSDIARVLRAEIQRRSAAGELSSAIEGDLVRRYGENVRAMPREGNARTLLGVALGVVAVLGALVIVRIGRGRSTVRVAATVPCGDDGDVDYQEQCCRGARIGHGHCHGQDRHPDREPHEGAGARRR